MHKLVGAEMSHGSRQTGLRIGELAERTGISVRTLHHYDHIGLLVPSRRSDAGYRLYGAAEITRLQQIRSLRGLGFSLAEIAGYLRRPDASLAGVLRLQLTRLRAQIAAQNALCERIEAVLRGVGATGEATIDALVSTMEAMTMVERHFTPEQRQEIEARGSVLGAERIRAAEEEWPRLMDEIRAEMERGTDPADERVQALARRWQKLVQDFTGGNPAIERSLSTMYQEEQEIHGVATAPVRELMAYVQRALAVSRKAE
jgi:DNA-binding transcriptional MerR regulator